MGIYKIRYKVIISVTTLMSKEYKFTYVLYLIEDNDLEKIMFLGTGRDPGRLYCSGLDAEKGNKEIKAYILKWVNLFQNNLDEQERKDLEYAFINNPEREFSYNIKNMTLYIKKIRNLNNG